MKAIRLAGQKISKTWTKPLYFALVKQFEWQQFCEPIEYCTFLMIIITFERSFFTYSNTHTHIHIYSILRVLRTIFMVEVMPFKSSSYWWASKQHPSYLDPPAAANKRYKIYSSKNGNKWRKKLMVSWHFKICRLVMQDNFPITLWNEREKTTIRGQKKKQ